MAKQNDVSLSALSRVRPRRPRPAAAAPPSGLPPLSDGETAGEDVMVPSFLWDAPREEPAAVSWKEDPPPARTAGEAREPLPEPPLPPSVWADVDPASVSEPDSEPDPAPAPEAASEKAPEDSPEAGPESAPEPDPEPAPEMARDSGADRDPAAEAAAGFAATPDAFLAAPPEGPDVGEPPAPDGAASGQTPPPCPPEPCLPEPPGAGEAWLRRFFLILGALAAVGAGLLLPYSAWWIFTCGDVAVERAVAMQAGGTFAMFGSGVSQDFVDYKLRLYAAVRPEIAVVGSSRVMQFRGSCFRRPFVNVGGTAGNLSVLRSTVDAMLRTHRPKAVILGLDFWWFSAGWQRDPFAPEPPTSGSYVYGQETLKAPWKWLLEGRIGWDLFFAPLTGAFRDDRFGIMAQRDGDGFASDGSWYYTAELTGRRRPFDYQFGDTLKQVRYGIKAFAPAPALSEAHLDAFAEIYCRLKSRGIQTYVFLAPLSATVLDAMRERRKDYPHLFDLHAALMERGIDVMDFTDPRKFGSSDCEFVDGFHGGEVTYARILRDLADRYHALTAYVDVERVNRTLKEWKGHAMVYDERVTSLPEIDFMELSCPKRGR